MSISNVQQKDRRNSCTKSTNVSLFKLRAQLKFQPSKFFTGNINSLQLFKRAKRQKLTRLHQSANNLSDIKVQNVQNYNVANEHDVDLLSSIFWNETAAQAQICNEPKGRFKQTTICVQAKQ
jgi:hypothetical protein